MLVSCAKCGPYKNTKYAKILYVNIYFCIWTIDNLSIIIVFLYEKKSNRPHSEHGPHLAHDTTSGAIFMENLSNSTKTQFDHFNFPLNFSWNLWIIVSKQIKKVSDFWT
jgi:hypothetical protein